MKTACGTCGLGCGVELVGEALRGLSEHPVNRGRLCGRAAHALRLARHPERLRSPLRRSRGGWRGLGWEEALDLIAHRLAELRERHGPQSIALIIGNPLLLQGVATLALVRRFSDALGTPHVFSVDSFCWRSTLIAHLLTFGRYALPDLDRAATIVLWAHNPAQSVPPRFWRIQQALERGARLVVIDPRRTEVARMAELHLRPRPGTDCALALGMMRAMLEEELLDVAFLDRWTTGLGELERRLRGLPLGEVERITGVAQEEVRRAARIFCSGPACVEMGWKTVCARPDGVQTARAIAILHLLAGHVGRPGTLVPISGPRYAPVRLLERVQGRPLGADRFELFYAVWGRLIGEGEGQATLFPAEAGRTIRAALVLGSNPLLTWPGSREVREAFGRLELLVVADLFMTATARAAHLVLPAAGPLEREEPFDFYRFLHGIPYLMSRKPVLPPEGCRSDLEICLELARRLGHGELFPWGDPEEAYDAVLAPSGLTMRALREDHPAGLAVGEWLYGFFERRGFPTPSGRAEIYSRTLEELGHDPLPWFREPPAGPLLLTGTRRFEAVHSRRQLRPEAPCLELHPRDARGRSEALLRTAAGQLWVRLRPTEELPPGVWSLEHGAERPNVNELTELRPADPISGFPAFGFVPAFLS